MDIKVLKENYVKSVEDYVKVFCEKHELDYEHPDNGWVGDDVGTILCIGDYFLSFDDIRMDIDKDVDEKEFFDWYDYRSLLSTLDCRDINYNSWLMGYRPYTEKQLQDISETRHHINELKEELFKMIDNTTKINS